MEQFSFLLQDGLIVSFQEKRGDFFTHIRERIRTNAGIVRKKKVDFLLYLLYTFQNVFLFRIILKTTIIFVIKFCKISFLVFIVSNVGRFNAFLFLFCNL